MDRVLVEAEQHGVKVILVFANNWNSKGLPPGITDEGSVAQVDASLSTYYASCHYGANSTIAIRLVLLRKRMRMTITMILHIMIVI